ncbi:cell division protein FtsQ [Actinomadura craniellae]|uniref:Cell division protein FtsQ n=1 Tax=Actinomadura craniellae TaxID=2231787 RepID=A0A365HBJ5_9ACTN|nr:FtsQ-type POTRA domain-containing protein [Actinomadura craniellae]RAY16524.1 cell division protein FtsQ [Actinomadura craniellae]
MADTETETDKPPEQADPAAESSPGPARTRRRLDRWKAAFVALLVLGVLGTAAWAVLGSRLLVVRQVEVAGTHLVARDRLVAAAQVQLGHPLARLDTGAVRDRVTALREVESARVERRWPTTVRIVVRERIPLVAVERGGRFYQLDRHGVTVTDTAARPGLPLLVVTAPGPADPATGAALRVLRSLPTRLTGRLVAIEAPGPEDVTLRLKAGTAVVWGAPERAAEKIRLIDALQGTPAGRSARSIDVSSPEVVTTS